MVRTPFDLTFEDLADTGVRASKAAIAEAVRGGVDVAALPTSPPPSPSGWTGERTDLLSKLWLDGLGASEIAKRLGGVTRNAVIGRVQKLGLPQSTPRLRSGVKIRTTQEAGVEATVITLGAHMCKWPIGDPSSDTFTFCGRRSDRDQFYCVEHARMAYAPASAKKPRAGISPQPANSSSSAPVIELRRRLDG
jgi:GcrA cell cycle regulator